MSILSSETLEMNIVPGFQGTFIKKKKFLVSPQIFEKRFRVPFYRVRIRFLNYLPRAA